jgi:SMODS and SLOG-associating 2TM effector domain 3
VPTVPNVRDPEDLPALYQSTNQQSLRAQRSFLMWFKVRLGGLLLAAIGGGVAWTVHDFRVGGAVAFVAFAVALAAELVLATQRSDRVWYEGRAAAESAKTLSWRYMVHGESFEASAHDPDARFLAELDDILHDLHALAPVRAENVVRARCDPKLIGDGRWSGCELDVQGVEAGVGAVVSSAGWPAGGPDCLSGLAVAGTGLFLPHPALARSDRRSSSLWVRMRACIR